jgi:16S rRNA (uracil1498-N3)-methyltransferase
LEGDEFRHLKVMRAAPGDTIELVNGEGTLAAAVLQLINKDSASLRIQNIQTSPPTQNPLIIAQAIPRMNRLDFILEKGCELGMDEIWLFPGHESEKKDISANQQERIFNILVASTKQCGRLWLPKVRIFPSFPVDFKGCQAFYGDIRKQAPLFSQVWHKKRPGQGVLFFIGPEKGFNSDEIEKLEDLGATGVRLHPYILRTDTAPLAALALMSHWLQEPPCSFETDQF